MSAHYDRIMAVLDNPTQREHGGPDTLHEAVFQALGAASTCWENMSGTGVFDNGRACEIGYNLIAFIEAHYDLKADE